MAEINAQTDKQFVIQKIYTKDISFETPNAPKIFTQKWEPTLDLNLGTHVNAIDTSVYEVSLTLTVTVKVGEATAFLVEVNQSGIFMIAGFTDQEMGPMLGSFCPNILFPYAREVISDLVSKGGFPQLILAPVNFDALYMQQLQQAQAQQAPEDKTLN
ncbi:protein-export chaperone SecB [Methylomonas sp. MED-D]|uniref:Protein-export protein SecB n=1 Tax=Methylomonas koyamae TaxID=702114 RepID=A0A177NKU7_9GAMM|nr:MULTISPECIES: protein-export chaperone SecB [Methylomonas]NJA04467.1 protein-export chaperone SecB [Methylococcaceae bacterium WWC4]OAI18746.1 preprotein translocase subunit SecB [Methylomonas koyamae]OHX35663.1 protein-export chaperone SecB [Methylomonas sp. LWB]WGS85863.1 protein-export chaperone SecB [Methylomonas sp. UP202]